MKYYEILFRDSYGICIKSEVINPTKQQVADFLSANKDKYQLRDIEFIDEISLEEARNFYDMEKEETFPVLKEIKVHPKYPLTSKTKEPAFNYLVRDNMKLDYYLFLTFNDALRQAESMCKEGSDCVLIYEKYFHNKTAEWHGQNTFTVVDGEVSYDKHARPELHLEFYVNAGEWLNPEVKL